MAHRIILKSLGGLSIALGAFVLSACQASGDAPAAPAKAASPTASTSVPSEANSSALTLVADASQVCMVNNQYMGRPQIPVQVDGKTYYGCCSMCKARLQSDASTRTAIDPVTNAPVDKGSAVIGRTPTGAALYFANLEHFQTYSRRARAR